MRVVTGVFPRLLSGLSTTGAGSGSAMGSCSGSGAAVTSDKHSTVCGYFMSIGSFFYPCSQYKSFNYIFGVAVMQLGSPTHCLASAFLSNAKILHVCLLLC